jgi:vacuolar-type H+-ATPase subunit I/STV1
VVEPETPVPDLPAVPEALPDQEFTSGVSAFDEVMAEPTVEEIEGYLQVAMDEYQAVVDHAVFEMENTEDIGPSLLTVAKTKADTSNWKGSDSSAYQRAAEKLRKKDEAFKAKIRKARADSWDKMRKDRRTKILLDIRQKSQKVDKLQAQLNTYGRRKAEVRKERPVEIRSLNRRRKQPNPLRRHRGTGY